MVAAVAEGGRRAGLIGDLAVTAAKHQDLDERVEDDPVGDWWAVAAKGMGGVVGAAVGQQRTELVPQRVVSHDGRAGTVLQDRWSGRTFMIPRLVPALLHPALPPHPRHALIRTGSGC